MSESLLFLSNGDHPVPAVLVESTHIPDSLASASGIYITASGSAMLQADSYLLRSFDQWLWLAAESGSLGFVPDSAAAAGTEGADHASASVSVQIPERSAGRSESETSLFSLRRTRKWKVCASADSGSECPLSV